MKTYEALELRLGSDVGDFHDMYRNITGHADFFLQYLQLTRGISMPTEIVFRGVDRSKRRQGDKIQWIESEQIVAAYRVFRAIPERHERDLEGELHRIDTHDIPCYTFIFDFGRKHENNRPSFKSLCMEVHMDAGKQIACVEYEEGLLSPRRKTFDIDGTELVQPTIAALKDYFHRQREIVLPEELIKALDKVKKVIKED